MRFVGNVRRSRNTHNVELYNKLQIYIKKRNMYLSTNSLLTLCQDFVLHCKTLAINMTYFVLTKYIYIYINSKFFKLFFFIITDLSNCQLMQVPDAVYHLMRHTELKTCDLSDNVITKIPPKFAEKFNLITDLNLSHNQMAKLPEEIAELGSLQRLDISYNTYIALPSAIFKIPKLKELNARNNRIVGE